MRPGKAYSSKLPVCRSTSGSRRFWSSETTAACRAALICWRVQPGAAGLNDGVVTVFSPVGLNEDAVDLLWHTVATHLVQEGVNLVTLRDLLRHRHITSTQIYIHLTAQDLHKATDKHPFSKLIKRRKKLLPNLKLPFQAGTLARFG